MLTKWWTMHKDIRLQKTSESNRMLYSKVLFLKLDFIHSSMAHQTNDIHTRKLNNGKECFQLWHSIICTLKRHVCQLYHTIDCCEDHGTSTRQVSSDLDHIGARLPAWTEDAGVGTSSGACNNIDLLSHQAMIQSVLQCKLGSTGAGCLHGNFCCVRAQFWKRLK